MLVVTIFNSLLSFTKCSEKEKYFKIAFNIFGSFKKPVEEKKKVSSLFVCLFLIYNPNIRISPLNKLKRPLFTGDNVSCVSRIF